MQESNLHRPDASYTYYMPCIYWTNIVKDGGHHRFFIFNIVLTWLVKRRWLVCSGGANLW